MQEKISIARLGKRIGVGIVLCICIAYACDYFLLRYRMSHKSDPFGAVEVHSYYAVPQKDGKTEFLFQPPESQTCVHSLFPHFGDYPCWYVSRRTQRRIDI